MNTPSIEQLKRAVEIKEEISQLENELATVLTGSPAQKPVSASGKTSGMSPAARAKIAAAQRARWAKAKRAKPAAASSKPAKRKGMSPAARAKIAAAAKARWAKAKAAGKTKL